jgi:predicted extracellular nuclease
MQKSLHLKLWQLLMVAGSLPIVLTGSCGNEGGSPIALTPNESPSVLESSTDSSSERPLALVAPTAGSIIINEYSADNDGNNNDFFELLVLTDGLDLRGLRVSDNELVSGTLNNNESVFVFGQDAFLNNVPRGTTIAVWTATAGVTPDTTTNPAASDWKMVLVPGTGFTLDTDGLGGAVNPGLSTGGEALYVYLPGPDGNSAGTDNIYLDFVSYEGDAGDPPSGLVDLNLADPADNAYYTGNTASGNDTASNWVKSADLGAQTPGDPNPTQDLSPLRNGGSTPTPSPSPTVSPSPTPSPSPTVSPSPSPSPTPGNITLISAIQGSGTTSPLVGQQVTIEGIVVGDFQSLPGQQPPFPIGGFFVQEENRNQDSDPATSEGILVFNNTIDVSVGQKVQVTGTVQEFRRGSETRTLTQISPTSAITIVDPNPGILDRSDPVDVDLPIPDLPEFRNPQDYLERYEGMLTRFPEQLSVTETFALKRFGEMTLSAEGTLDIPTNVVEPGAPAIAQLRENNRRRILVDDGSSASNSRGTTNPLNLVPYINPAQPRTLRRGSTVRNLTGILTFDFSQYRIQPTEQVQINYASRPDVPSVGRGLKVASFNVLNYFNTIDDGSGTPRGADSANEFNRQRQKLFSALRDLDADIVGLIEVENNGDGDTSAISNLVEGLNTTLGGSPIYDYIRDPKGFGSFPGSDDEIKVAFIYKQDRVKPIGDPIALNNPAFSNARAPLAQVFRDVETGGTFVPIINHFKSKSPTGASGLDLDQGDGQAAFNESRKNQALALLAFVNEVKQTTGEDDVMIFGDFNAYKNEDPIDILRQGGLQLLEGDNTDTTFVFSGEAGALDHALVTNSMAAQVERIASWDLNAEEPTAVDYEDDIDDGSSKEGSNDRNLDTALFDGTNGFRSSDHDPVLVGVSLAPNTDPEIRPVILRDELPEEIASVLKDPTDPLSTTTYGFRVVDRQDRPMNVTVTATSSNPSVITDIRINKLSLGRYTVQIQPRGVGFTTVTIEAKDTAGGRATIEVDVAVSDGSPEERNHAGACDASTAVALNSIHMVVADDEDQTLRIYDRRLSGPAISSFDFTQDLALTDLDDGEPREVDIEASTQDRNRIYWLGSHSNRGGSGRLAPNRYRIFATDINGFGERIRLSYVGRYDTLRTDLVNWDIGNLHGKGANFYGFNASTQDNKPAEAVDGFNIEGLTLSPNGRQAFIAFRAPQVPASSRSKALVVPLLNLPQLVQGNPSSTTAQFGAPFELDLGGRGIRSLECNRDGCLIVAGSVADNGDFKLYRWSGTNSGVQLQPTDLTGINPEGIVELPRRLSSGAKVQLISDDGSQDLYGTGEECKDLENDTFKLFRSKTVILP